ncbi:family type I secretion periplasmic adaptor subunit [Chlorella sorokiniana]|uniref:Family type I secretion periplasmic adaptor subunit n=1 Tax=Chlorella sorokiniana TaxID=3076 RepID=A0A2P6TCV4_CHLSO|nr:family type I secretion periplasmic adaptor subunit [Chlorella sorokiniana]|eukprot:PRW20469.1 family type I secretion periplasmic adaptor subunit [Chlorella sorokiniana]
MSCFGCAREAPLEERVLVRKLVQPLALRKQSGSNGSTSSSSTQLSELDTLSALSATARAWGFAGAGRRVDAEALEAALALTLTDLPVLAGRITGLKKLRLGSLAVAHSGRGALLVVAERRGLTVEQAMSPAGWPRSGLTAANQQLPFYVEPLDLGRNLCHAILDGMRWPGLAAHLAARYRQAAGGPPAEAHELLHPIDRSVLSLEREAGLEGWQPPASVQVRCSLAGYWRAARGLSSRARAANELALLHVPQEGVTALKAMAAVGNPAITTGDAVQAAAALLIHAAHAHPLLPVAPQAMAAMVLLPTPKDFFGNAVRMLSVSLPADTKQPAEGDALGALRALAGGIRQATLRFRSDKEEVALALAEAQALAGAPVLRMLCHVFSEVLPHMQSATNYVPVQQGLELWGLGPASHTHPLSWPRAADMAVIRPSAAPFLPGLFFQFVLPPAAMAHLRASPLLLALLPTARWVGGSNGSS